MLAPSSFPRCEPRVPFHEPSRHRAIQLRKMSREKVIPAADDFHFCVFSNVRRKLFDHCAQLDRWSEPIEFAGHQKLRFIAVIEISEAACAQIADRQSEANELGYARIAATGAQADPG